jgi:hypothetical protein
VSRDKFLRSTQGKKKGVVQMISQKQNTRPNQKKGGNKMYTLEETKQFIHDNLPVIQLDDQEITEILNSTDNTRKFKITAKANTEDYSYPATDYYITEIYIPVSKRKEK